MKIGLHSANIKGSLSAPPSKSHMQRVVAAAALSEGKSIIHHPGYSNDCKSALGIAAQMGAEIQKVGDSLSIHGQQHEVKQLWDCGEAGLSIRMFGAIASLFDKSIQLIGHGSLATRPMHFFEELFPKLGVVCKSNDGTLPLTFTGPLQAGKVTVDGRLSSQYLTGLLMALPLADGDSELEVIALKSKPYIDLTLAVLQQYGIRISHHNYQQFHIPGKQQYQAQHIRIEGDWSSMSFPITAAAIGGSLSISDLNLQSTQADSAIVTAVKKAGATVSTKNGVLHIQKGDLTAFDFDATDCPDLFPPLVVLAAHATGKTSIKGVHRLYHKESNRALVLQKEFAKFGVAITLEDDTMYIDGTKTFLPAAIHANNDHRIAMAACIMAAGTETHFTIDNAECVAKSYPNFYKDMQTIGFHMKNH